MNQSPLLQAIELHKAFDGEAVLEGVSLSVEEGQSAVVMGPSGTGKSVMLKHFVQLHRPDRGEVWVAGERIDQLRGDQLDRARRQMGYLFQGGALFDSMSVRENLAFVLERNTSLDAEARRERILETLEWVALTHTLDQYPAELSGGQRTRIALARAAVLRPRILLYDEPTTGLDPIAVRRVAQLIRRLQEERGITSITITHDLLLA
ncbi:MAG: ATP-binding cassette domain-containing protein, partial [Bacteroidota bacterium]